MFQDNFRRQSRSAIEYRPQAMWQATWKRSEEHKSINAVIVCNNYPVSDDMTVPALLAVMDLTSAIVWC